jgi:ribosomal protein S18 acetylase RimI-like enzyme
MNVEVHYTKDLATYEDIARHLLQCDAEFVPALSTRVQIPQYAGKLIAHAARFEAWQEGTLVGLIAAYCDDRQSRRAYISSVSVLAESRRRGLGACLLERCLDYLRGHEFMHVELQVDSKNDNAIRLYERYGFHQSGTDGRTTTMDLKLGRNK